MLRSPSPWCKRASSHATNKDLLQGTRRQALPMGAAGRGTARSEAETSACCWQSGGLPICSVLAEGSVLPHTGVGAEAVPCQLQGMGPLLKGPLLHCHAHVPLLQQRFMESNHGHVSVSCFVEL